MLWADWPAFKRQTGSLTPSVERAEVLEVALAACWLGSLNALTKSSPLVSIHDAARGTLLDFTEVVVHDHAPVFQTRLLIDPSVLVALDPQAKVVLRVYDVEAAVPAVAVGGPEGAVVIPPGDKALVGETAPISLATLLACRDAKEVASFRLSNSAVPALGKKLEKKGACVTVLAVGRPGETVVDPAFKPPASSARVSIAPVTIPAPLAFAPSTARVKTPVPVACSTPFGATGLTLTADQVVLVDAAGKEHRPPTVGALARSPKSGDLVSLSVTASNLPKVHAMAAMAAPLVALWERTSAAGAYALLAHTEPAAGADPHFQRTLTTRLSGAATPSPSSSSAGAAAAGAEQYRLDVFDLGHGDPRVTVGSDRIGFAFLSRGELVALASAADHAERTLPLRSDRGPTWERKLVQRGAVLQLSRADAPPEKLAERKEARAQTLEAKRVAMQQKKDAWIAARGGASPVPAVKQAPSADAASAGAAAAAASETTAAPAKPAAAQPSCGGGGSSSLPPLPTGTSSRRNSFAGADQRVEQGGTSSRRGSLNEAESVADMEGALLAEKVARARLDAATAALAGLEAKGNNAKAQRDRAAAEAEVAAAQAELTAASERAAIAKETLAARRRQRAELSEAEARARASADAENASNPNYTPWGMRKRGNSIGHERGTGAGSTPNSRPGSGTNSARQSLSLGGADNSRTDIRDLVLARRMAAAAAAASASSDASLPARFSGVSSVFALQCSVRNVKNTGAWNPCVAVYERLPLDGGADSKPRWAYLDHTEKVSGAGESGAAAFNRQMLVEHFPAEKEHEQVLRFCLYNAGAKDEASAADLIGSGSVPLRDLAALLAPAGSGRAAEVFLYNASNRVLSDRLKRQHASIVVTLAHCLEEQAGSVSDAASRGFGLALSHAPVPLSMLGGADPDPAAMAFAPTAAAEEADAKTAEAAPATATATAAASTGSEVPASVAAAVADDGAAADAAPEKEAETATAAAAAASPAESPAATPAAAPEASDAEGDEAVAAAGAGSATSSATGSAEGSKKKKKKNKKKAAGKSSVEASPAASVDLAQEPKQRDALAAEAAALAADNQAESTGADADGDADATAGAASGSASGGGGGGGDAQKKKNKKKKKGGK